MYTHFHNSMPKNSCIDVVKKQAQECGARTAKCQGSASTNAEVWKARKTEVNLCTEFGTTLWRQSTGFTVQRVADCATLQQKLLGVGKPSSLWPVTFSVEQSLLKMNAMYSWLRRHVEYVEF